jgi:hypothetical protein
MVLPDGPATRGAATSWRVYLFRADLAALVLPIAGIKLPLYRLEVSQQFSRLDLPLNGSN